jgi:hypothetical protein
MNGAVHYVLCIAAGRRPEQIASYEGKKLN